MKIVRVNFCNEFCMAIQNVRVSVSLSAGKLLPQLSSNLERNGESLSSQPANQIFHFSGGYISSAREHLSNQARQIAQDCRFSTSRETRINILNIYIYCLLLPKYWIDLF